MHACGHCNICKYVHKTDVFTNTDGTKKCKIKQFINCSTTSVIYMLCCLCNKMYIGKTKRQLRIRIGEHIASIKKQDDERPLALHFTQFHQGNPNGVTVKGVYVLNLLLGRETSIP